MEDVSPGQLPAWEVGSCILYEEIWAEQLLAVRPVTVAASEPGQLALFTPARTRYRSAAMGSARRQRSLEESVAVMTAAQLPPLQRREGGDRHVLVLTPENRWHAVWLFWSTAWEHLGWYVNFQMPIQRTARGVQIRDCALDVVVDRNRSWSWKDRDEFVALRDRGFFPPGVCARVEAEAVRVLEAIERWEAPFCSGWEAWRPDPRWTAPVLDGDPPGSAG